MIHLNASQRLGLGASVTLALADVLVERGITVEPKALGQISEATVKAIIEAGEGRR